MISQTISHYRILQKLGAGGMGEVYLAQDTKLDRTVALKLLPADVALDQKRTRRFLQEAKAASALSHPNVCVIHEVGEMEDQRPFMVMEYVQGQTLDAKIGGGPLKATEIVDIGLQVADALDAAHSQGIIHRDIKSSNIMITARGQVKVMDFGLAKLAAAQAEGSDSEVSTRLATEPGLVMGTVSYMSPEQAMGDEVDQRTDIFSLGVVFYEMATGTRPFKGHSQTAIIDEILHKVPTSPVQLNPELPIELAQIISKMLEKARDMRYQTASDLRADLMRLKRDTESGRVATLIAAASPTRSRDYRRLVGPLVGVILALLLALAIPSTRRIVGEWWRGEGMPAEKHLVVLPFTNVGGGPTNQAFCDGLVETMASKLTQLEQFFQPSLWVVPASEVRKSGVTTAREAQRAFGVTLAVTGSVQREGDRVRLTLNLVDAKTLRQLRSSVMDERMGNISDLQDGVVTNLAEMLKLELDPRTSQVLAAGHTAAPSAYDFYVQGRGYLQRYEKMENLDTAINLFGQALKQDSRYALAYAGLGEAYWRKYKLGKEAQWIESAVKNCEDALRLNDQLAPVHVTLGQIHTDGRYEQAVQEFQHALGLDPVSADAYRGLARAYEAQRKVEPAEATYKKAIELRPSYWAGYNDLGVFYYNQARDQDAVTQFRQVVALTPDNYWGYNNLAGAYLLLERWSDARQMFERSIEIKPNYAAYSNLGTLYFQEARYADAAQMFEKALELDDHDYRVRGSLAWAYYWAPGQRQKAQALYPRAIQMAEEQRKMNPRDPSVLADLAAYYGALENWGKALPLLERALSLAPDNVEVMALAANIYEHFGKRERALQWIGKALEHGYSPAQLERDPALKQWRADARFQRLLKHGGDKR